MFSNSKKRETAAGSYMYRPKRIYSNGLPFRKRLINRIEKINKFLLLRLLGKLLRVHPLKHKLELSEISSVLFIRYDAFGDMVVTTPLWRILKRLKPSIKIGVAGSKKNLGVIEADTDIDVIYDYSANSLRDLFPRMSIARQEKWDLVIICKFNQKTRGGIISRLSTKNGFNVTVGTANAEGHQALFSKLVPLPKPQQEIPMTEQLQILLHSVINLPGVQYERPSVMIDENHKKNAKKEIDTMLKESKCEKYLVINIDAPEVRKWSLQNNISLAHYIESAFDDYLIIIISLPSNETIVKKSIKESLLVRTKYFSTSNVQYLLTVIRYASLVITPDTGIAHLASTEQKPIIGLYPEAGEWLPYKVHSYIIIPKKGEPISSISLDVVKEGVKQMILRNGDEHSIHIVYSENP
jgi:ADP-heptose:LPS heptosyltransferase